MCLWSQSNPGLIVRRMRDEGMKAGFAIRQKDGMEGCWLTNGAREKDGISRFCVESTPRARMGGLLGASLHLMPFPKY